MKSNVIRELKTDELQEHLVIETEALNKLKMNHAVSQLENPLILRTKRKTIARLKTEIRRREIQNIK